MHFAKRETVDLSVDNKIGFIGSKPNQLAMFHAVSQVCVRKRVSWETLWLLFMSRGVPFW